MKVVDLKKHKQDKLNNHNNFSNILPISTFLILMIGPNTESISFKGFFFINVTGLCISIYATKIYTQHVPHANKN